MFVPFVIDVIRDTRSDDFGLEEVKVGLLSKYGFNVPRAVLQTILKRIIRKGGIRREGGLYLRNPQFLDNEDLAKAQEDIERQHTAVSDMFVSFA